MGLQGSVEMGLQGLVKTGFQIYWGWVLDRFSDLLGIGFRQVFRFIGDWFQQVFRFIGDWF